jgi:tetratricopeptide (TPR) repeat protein
VPAGEVAELLDDTSVQMVFLNACASARAGELGRAFYPFQGVAQACINLGISAALAMQVEIVDSAAAQFAREFYASLADGQPVEQAVLDARQLAGKAKSADWAVPVLYSRVLAGPILKWKWTPWWKRLLPLVAVLLGLVAVAALIFGLFIYVPPMPASSFNVAVAQFAAIETDGHLTKTDESQRVSQWLFEAIRTEVDQLPPALHRGEVRKPSKTGMVRGQDDRARAAEVARLAERHNATILIYGFVTTDHAGAYVQPVFYVRDETFGYGSEVATSERLGQPVSFALPLDDPGQYEINKALLARKQALQSIISGLAYLYVGEYDNAWTEFQDAADVEDWQADEGKEVVYLLIGAAKLRYYNQEIDFERRVDALQDAADAFAQAYSLNDAYARSYLGLGAVALQQAVLNVPGGADGQKLNEAWSWYMAGLQAPEQPATAHVAARASYGLGQLHLVGYECRLRGWPGGCDQADWSADEARRLFGEVIAAQQDSQATDLLRLTAQAHGYLCRLAGLEQRWEEMLSECRTAIEILDDLPGDRPVGWIARYRAYAAYAKLGLQRPEDARQDCLRAVQEGQGRIPPGELEQWQADLDCSNE